MVFYDVTLFSGVKRSPRFSKTSGSVNSGMICIQVVNGGSEQVWTVAGNILSKKLRRGGPPVWVLKEN
jgi:hypothetical protein